MRAPPCWLRRVPAADLKRVTGPSHSGRTRTPPSRRRLPPGPSDTCVRLAAWHPPNRGHRLPTIREHHSLKPPPVLPALHHQRGIGVAADAAVIAGERARPVMVFDAQVVAQDLATHADV